MSTLVQPRTRRSGCERHRAKAIARREHVTALTHAREDAAFFEHGTIPPSSTGFATCPCGVREFTREEGGLGSDFYNAHADCDDYWERS